MTGETPASVGHDAKTAAKEGLGELFEALFRYVLPLILVIVGFFAAPLLGGFNSLWNVFNKLNSTTPNLANYGAAAVMIGLWTAVGGCFWYVSTAHKTNLVAVAAGRGIGGFFFGAALGWVPQLLNPSSEPVNGAIDIAVADIQAAVDKATPGGSGGSTA